MKNAYSRHYRILRFKLLKLWYRIGSHPILQKYFGGVRHRTRRVASLGMTSALIVIMVFSLVFPAAQVKAQTLALGSNDLLEGSMQYGQMQLTNSNSQLSLQQGNVGTWNQTTADGMQMLPELTRGTAWMTNGPNNKVYHISASTGNCYFRSYDVELQKWDMLKSVPVGCGSGTKIVGDGARYIYYVPGNSTSLLYRYDIGADSWDKLQDIPSQVTGHGDMKYVTKNNVGYLYLFRGASSASFLRYNVAANQWDTLAPFPTSSNVTLGVAMAWDENDTIYVISNERGEFKSYSIANNTWSNLLDVSMGWNTRQNLTYISGKIYATKILAHGTRDHLAFSMYNISNGTWSDLAAPPHGAHQYDWAPPTVYDGSRYMYVQFGTEIYQDIYRYDTQANTWNSVSLYTNVETDTTDWHQFPIFDGVQTIYYAGGDSGSSVDRIYKHDLVTKQTTQIGNQINTASGWNGIHKSGALYMMPYENNKIFQKYDLATNAWTQLSDLPFESGWGGNIVDGNDGYLYVSFGGRVDFYRYNIATNTWGALTSMPLRTSSGGGIARIGTTIYASTGGGTGRLYRYNMTTNAWTEVTNFIPNAKIDHGGFITTDGSRYLYLGTGTRTDPENRRLFRFDTTNDTWQRLADLPASTNVGASAFYDTTNSKLYVSQSRNSGRLWSWSPSAANYVTTGTWYSKTYSLKQVESWQSLQATVGGTGTSTISTRTSDDGRIWTNWQTVSGTSINSPVNKYIQMKVTLTGNGSSSPTVSGLTINYSQETVAPNLPSQFTAYSKAGSQTQLSSGQTYEHQHPYFKWAGASDGANGSGVDGYYVYFGTDSNADPVTDGNYQTNADYTVTAPMVAGEVYYIRIKVKDKLGNISAAATYFSYRYWYISPPGSQLMTSDMDFNGGTNTKVAIGDGAMKLRNISTGSWGTGAVDSLPDTPYGSSEVIVGNHMYMMRGNSTPTMWRYDLLNRVWQTMADAPTAFTAGSSMTYDGTRYIYAIAGGNTNRFYRYDTVNDSWDTRENLPSGAQLGSDIKYIGNGKIAMIFTGGREFYIYDIASGSYSSRQSYPSTITYGGSGIWYDGDDSIYLNMGTVSLWDHNDNSRTVFAKYSLSSDTWRALSPSPVSPIYNQNNLVSDGRGGLYMFTSEAYNYLSKNQTAYRYDIAADSWTEADGLTSQVIYGSVVSDDERYIYIIPSDNGVSKKLIRYDTWKKQYTPTTKNIGLWERVPLDWPGSDWVWRQGTATTATYDGSKYVYALGADEGYATMFARYDPETGETKYLPPPYYGSIGGSMAYLNGYVYFMRAGNSREMMRYDIAQQKWDRMADIPANSYRPSPTALQVVGSSIYALLGNGNRMYQYTPNGSTGTWTAMANLPGTLLNGSVVKDAANGYLYVLAGNSTSAFYRYSISSNTWSTMASLPMNSTYGSAMTLKDGKIYAAAGSLTRASYIYDIASNSWTQGTDTPETFSYGAVMLPIGSQRVLVFAGDNSPDLWHFNYPSTTTAYEGSATHISQTFTTPGIFDYAGITAQADIPAGTSVEFFTRTSSDGNNWGKWTLTTDTKYYNGQLTTKVASTPRLYTQIKVVLESSDNLYSPSVGSYALNYYYDVDPPTNPSVMKVYKSSSRTDEFTSNVWYNSPSPIFDWPDPGQPGGATDGPLGSNMAGYWVYLGQDPTASPRTAGQFVTSSEFIPTLQTSGTYYLRIQAQDITGNVDGNIYAPFVYKFDKDPPNAPNLITVTPGGYTTTNNFTFDWPVAFDAHSGISGYCYHTGATSGPFATEVCQPGRNLANISAAYRTGTNVFYLRTIDAAGNYSSSYTTVSYYYSTDPPSPPTNLRAIPPSSPQNLFAFAWDLPSLYSGDPNQLDYCYSINELPSPLNTTCTGERFISPFKAATRQGTNVLYMVTKDEAGNANWNNYAISNFIANTVSPGIPLNLVVTDTSDRVASRWSLTLTWDTPTFEGNGITNYVVERSPDGHAFTEIGKTSTVAFVDLGVQPDTTYYYRVRAADSVDNRGGPSGTVSGTPKGSFTSPPTIVVQPNADADFDQATIRWATNRQSTSFVYYGTNPSDLSQSKGSLDLVSDHSVTISGLNPSSTYYYRVQSFDNERSYNLADSFSQIFYLKTQEAARIFNVSTEDTTLSSTVLKWQTSVPTEARIEYGTTPAYGLSATSDGGYSGSHTFKLDGLQSGTTYHFRIVGRTSFGSTIRSDDYKVTTISRPVISNIRFDPLENEPTTAVRVTWQTNVPTSSVVHYQGTGIVQEAAASELKTTHEMILKDLASSTEYQIRLEGRDRYGNLTTSEDQRWRSGYDTRAPSISESSFSMTTTEGLGSTRAQVIVSWKTDEPSTSQVAYGKLRDGKLDKTTPLDTEPTTNHVVIISNLDLADIYKIQIMSNDISGNKAYKTPTLVVTPDKETSVLDSVITLMQRLFRF